MEAAADFCQNELLPLNRIGDQQGCKLENGVVTTPDGFKDAYKKYVELGFTSLTGDEQYGGQGFPTLFRIAISEIITSTNWAWGMYLDSHMEPCELLNIMVPNSRSSTTLPG